MKVFVKVVVNTLFGVIETEGGITILVFKVFPDGTVGEDVNFSRAAIAAGYDIWCDLDLTYEMGHVGEIVVPCVRPDPSPSSAFKQPATTGGSNAA